LFKKIANHWPIWCCAGFYRWPEFRRRGSETCNTATGSLLCIQ